MAQYILIIREDLTKYPIAENEMKELVDAHVRWAQELSAKGIFKSGNGVKSHGKLIELNKGELQTLPLRDAKDGVGGYYIVEADSFDVAIEIAKQMPTYYLGDKVEVRELGS